MKKNIVSFNVFCIAVIFLGPDNCTSANGSNDEALEENQNVNTNTRSTTSPAIDYEYPFRPVSKKWQVGRVSRKHYEIVNMLWRKTKEIDDTDTSTISNKYIHNNLLRLPKTVLPTVYHTMYLPYASQSSTPSYIEFYYIDDSDLRLKRKDDLNVDQDSDMREQTHFKHMTVGYPQLSFRVNAAGSRATPHTKNTRQYEKFKSNLDKPYFYEFFLRQMRSKVGVIGKPSFTKLLYSNIFETITCPSTTQLKKNATVSQNTTQIISSAINNVTTRVTTVAATTPYDKIKFFEIYDKHTQMAFEDNTYNNNPGNLFTYNVVSENQKLLEEMNKNIGHDEAYQKIVKKHVIKEQINMTDIESVSKTTQQKTPKYQSVNFRASKTDNFTTYLQNHLNVNDSNIILKTVKSARNASRPAPWPNYPFAAVYIYEPSQIHCDAAALSPHWLIAAGSCLSRFRQKDPMTDGQSAFVAYCGEYWWQPERVAYVKYSIVHPLFNAKDKIRRNIYNIGLIQIVGSMASACYGWAPISLMSHHFESEPHGSLASAVGWGLDRYDVKHSSSMPQLPLSVYEDRVYSASCPGSASYRKLQSTPNEDATKNIYCLNLPEYYGEEGDPIHGTMLLVGGKLIAMYIQEERRPWGVQSAQYTGVWRLVPWVNEVAREPEDGDIFELEL